MIVAIVIEVLVGSFKHAPVVRILIRLVAILAEQDAVLVLYEKIVRRPWLPAEIVQHRGHVEIDVRIRIEQPACSRQIVRVPPEVRQDVLRLRVPADHVVALGHQFFEPDAFLMTAIGIQRKLEPAFVRVVERLKEGLRFRDMNQHRHVLSGAGVPNRIELRIVHAQPASVGPAIEHAQVLENLQPDRASLEIALELLRRPGAETGRDRLAEIDIRKQHHPVLVTALPDRLHAVAQPITGRAAQVYKNAKIVFLHPLDHAGELAIRDWRGLVAVDINHRKFRARHRMLRHDQRRPGLVLANRRRRELRFTALRRARANLAGPLLCRDECGCRNRGSGQRGTALHGCHPGGKAESS